MIGPYFEGGTALDLFAGTGGLGIEALSRGMDKAIFVDLDYKSVETVKANLKAAGFTEQAEVYKNDAERALKTLAKRGASFDLVFLDPPYRLKHGDKLMARMDELSLLKDQAVLVLEYESSFEYRDDFGRFRMIRKTDYGETGITIYVYDKDSGTESDSTEKEERHEHGEAT